MIVPFRRWSVAVATGVTVVLMLSTAASAHPFHPAPGRSLDPGTKFYTPAPVTGAAKQIQKLIAGGQFRDAKLLLQMVSTPQGVWLESGTPRQVKHKVQHTVALAYAHHAVPIFVVYYVPGRDCAQYSAGGAPTGDAYKAWIDGIVAGLDDAKAVIIVEPDGLALLPTDCGQPDTYDRVSLINYAAHAFLGDPNAAIYLDAGHSAWHNVTDMASRLVAGGVLDVNGFYLDPSNYQFTENETQFGTWISDCIALGVPDCPNQYWNGGPLPSLIAQTIGEWTGDALSRFGRWSDADTTVVNGQMPFNTSGINQRYTNMLADAAATPTVHFVIDTSRNGQGPWAGTNDHPYTNADTQDWCNPPDRGLGPRPTANTGVPLLDAYLWIKLPGASDGECFRWTAGPLDPARNRADPAAGKWFPEMALELVHNAAPPLHVH